MSKWYNVEVIDKNSPMARAGFYMYARKSGIEGKVVIHNGRHFTAHITQEEARKIFKINKVLPDSDQEQQERDFDYYLHF